MHVPDREQTLVLELAACTNVRLAVGALRAGALPFLDVTDVATAADAAQQVVARAAGTFGVRPTPAVEVEAVEVARHLPAEAELVLLDAAPALDVHEASTTLAARIEAWAPRRVLVTVTSRAEADDAVAAGAAGLVAKGSESGGRIGDTETFVLLQQLRHVAVPVWAQGGIGLHTAAAAIVGGAAGVVLDAQLALVKESGSTRDARAAIGAMDGSETDVVAGHRFFTRPDLPAAAVDPAASPAAIAARLGPDPTTHLLPVGQDGSLAAPLAARFATVGGVVQALRAAVAEHLADAAGTQPLAPGSGVAEARGLRYPIAQGPMTRVSDRAEFAASVAAGGGLPFLALALMTGPEVRRLLEQTADLLGDRPWGVGILGFVPPEVRNQQLEVVHDIRPPVALIAGGRPSQAEPLEEVGIATYLHVPSPGLLDRFVKEGARRFVFEGRECGGHVGPRASFPLWESQIERLLAFDRPEELEILLAGGIHDATSAAMAAAAAAPLAARGAHIGVLMGTAYLFTEEAVAGGAITARFQSVAAGCERTVLLETSPGHATRCVETDYVRTFAERKAELVGAGADSKAMWADLEQLNLGRLRIASKGVERAGDDLVELDDATQAREGMFMIGQVATLRSGVTTIAELHHEVSAGSVDVLDEAAARHGAGSDLQPVVAPPLDIAIVGMASIFPGASSTDELWANIVAGTNSITEVSPERWDVDRYFDPDGTPGETTPSKWGGFVPEVGFDPFAYGIPPNSLASIEPVQLLSLEVAAQALADAGYAEREFDRDRASVVFGAESGTDLAGAYGFRATFPGLAGDLPPALDDFLPGLTEDSFPGVLTNVIAGRIANRLDLGGVNYTVDAACASSLAALDAGCKELQLGNSDLVLCGGADLHNGIADYLLFSSVRALSPTGQCKPFDASADGIALGEGIACVVLKRLADAERDGDRIYAVLEGIGGSSDGRHLGLTAPRKEGQQRAVARAHAQAARPPATLGLVEAHGTGTVVGDRTEMATLTEIFGEYGASPQSCVLGSVKSQIGHTKCAAGLAGVIKAARAIHHGVLPPTVNLTSPNAAYDAKTSPFRFLDRAHPWPTADRRAGVSAFGFGGTNFHVVLSSHRGGEPARHGLTRWPAELFLFRAPTRAAADERIAELAGLVTEIVRTDPQGQRHQLRDLACTVSQAGRGRVQAAVVADDLPDLAAKLAALRGGGDLPVGVFVAPGADDAAATGEAGPAVGLLYPGQGSQRPDMLADLFVAFPWLDDLLVTGERWADVLFPPTAFTPDERKGRQAAITDTRNAQPTLGIAGLAMTRVLAGLGVRPAGLAGHSYGELVALSVAGSFDDATLLDLSDARGQAIVSAASVLSDDAGAMAAVSLPVDELTARIAPWPDLVVANHNAPRQAVLSGPTGSVDAAVNALLEDGISAKRIAVSCAFHSPVIAGAATLLAERLDTVEVAPPRLPVWSTSTGAPYPDEPAEIRAQLADQVASPVHFVDQIEGMYAAGIRVFVEAGPGRVLTQLVGKILGERPHTAIACDASGEHGIRRLLLAVGALATAGVPVDPSLLFDERARVLDLRTLPAPVPGWSINGHLVRDASGASVPNSLQPADARPVVTLAAGPAPAGLGGEPDGTVLEYLRSIRELVAAERDVMLRYLGAAPGTAPDLGPVIEAATVAPLTTPVEAGAEAAALPSAGAGAVLSGEALLAAVLGVVSDRTGYPADMLDPDLDLEADLSIDSIKRMEILAELADTIGLPGIDASSMDDSVVEELAQIKTLRGIVAWIDDHADAAPVPAAASREAPAAAVLSGEALLAAVLGVVSDRTGYPADMLDPDLDLEADLSIDSIKRMEILAELADTIGLPGIDASSMDDSVVEELAQIKTLRGIVAWIDDHSGASTPAGVELGPPEPATAPEVGPDVPPAAVRYEVELAVLPPATNGVPIVGGRFVVLADEGSALAAAVAARLTTLGAHAEVLAQPPGDDLPTALLDALAGADGLIHLGSGHADTPHDARLLFPALRHAALGGTSRLVAVTGSGGHFALSVNGEAGDPAARRRAATGARGLMKTLAAEFPDAHVRAVDIDPGTATDTPEHVADLVVGELLDAGGPVEVGWHGAARVSSELVARAALPGTHRPPLPLGPDSVVLVTGGARGITAKVALALAAESGCSLVLVGRSPLPGPEDPRTAQASGRADLRRTLLELGELRTPAEIEAECSRLLGAREIRATLDELAALGVQVDYHALDVRDTKALGDLIDGVYERHGRLDGVVHGAGVLDDRFIRDKTPEGFERVFATKVDAAHTILDHVRDDAGFVVFFGSVSGVFGNRGQVDYAAANDALDGLARIANVQRAGRVVSVDWGPWQGAGMVSDDLEREYRRRGIGLIEVADGVRALLDELRAGPDGAAQAVVMRAHHGSPFATPATTAAP